jgi:hypothetical protein
MSSLPGDAVSEPSIRKTIQAATRTLSASIGEDSEMVRKNADTEYGRRYGFGSLEYRRLSETVPIVT